MGLADDSGAGDVGGVCLELFGDSRLEAFDELDERVSNSLSVLGRDAHFDDALGDREATALLVLGTRHDEAVFAHQEGAQHGRAPA
jgi:hypothetical protein